MHVCIYISVKHAHMFIGRYTYVCVHMCVHTCVWMDRQADRKLAFSEAGSSRVKSSKCLNPFSVVIAKVWRLESPRA
jgi:hypothetical protein